MAIVTKTVASYDDGRVQLQILYDDATLRITAVRCINDSAFPVYAEAVQDFEPDAQSKKGRKYGATFQAGTTTEIAVPTAQNVKLQYTIDPVLDTVDGVGLYSRWPA